SRLASARRWPRVGAAAVATRASNRNRLSPGPCSDQVRFSRYSAEARCVLNQIWAPWRAQYVQTPAEPMRSCFLCAGLAGLNDRENLVVHRAPNSFVVLNRYPYNNGHLLVAPNVHRGTLTELEGRDLLEPIETIRRMIALLERMFRPQGFNIGLNQGK